jgi:hypothetical protein
MLERTEIFYESKVLSGEWLDALRGAARRVRANRRRPPYHNWHRVDGRGFTIGVSDPIVSLAPVGWSFRLELSASAPAAARDALDQLVGGLMASLPGSRIVERVSVEDSRS